jgi:hypothetical protein
MPVDLGLVIGLVGGVAGGVQGPGDLVVAEAGLVLRGAEDADEGGAGGADVGAVKSPAAVVSGGA